MGGSSSFAEWLKGSRLGARDLVMVLSVGGGDASRNISLNLVRALELARDTGCRICGIVGRDGASRRAWLMHASSFLPSWRHGYGAHEAFQAVIWHLLVSHPRVRTNEMKWESVR